MTETTRETPLDCDSISNYHQKPNQTEAYFHEPKLAIQTFTEAINKYCDVSNVPNKCTGIREFPGSGKTWAV